MKLVTRTAIALAATLAIAGCAQVKSAAKNAGVDDKTMEQAEDAAETGQAEAEKVAADAPKTVLQTTMMQGNHTTFLTALEKAGLYRTLEGDGPYTIFAPTDAAFQSIPKDKREELLNGEDTTALKALLEGHLVDGKMDVAAMVEQEALTAVGGANLTLEPSGDKRSVKVAGTDISIPDLEASNGVVHVLDVVLIPGGNS